MNYVHSTIYLELDPDEHHEYVQNFCLLINVNSDIRLVVVLVIIFMLSHLLFLSFCLFVCLLLFFSLAVPSVL